MKSVTTSSTRRGTAIALQLGVAVLSLLLVQCGKKAEVSNLPEIPADLAGELKSVPGTRYYLIQPAKKPVIKSVPTTGANPGGGDPGGGIILKKACAGSTTYAMDAIYPVLICHSMLDDLRPPNGGATETMARVAASVWAPEGKNKYQIPQSAKGPLVCADARMPVRAELTKVTTCEDGSDQYISYKLDLNGLITLVWIGDTNARPEGLILFDPWTLVGTPSLFPCSGASTGNSACPTGGGGSGGGNSPAAAKSRH